MSRLKHLEFVGLACSVVLVWAGAAALNRKFKAARKGEPASLVVVAAPLGLAEIAARHFPSLTTAELALLHPSEASTAPLYAAAKNVEYERSDLPAALSEARREGPAHRYFVAPDREIRIDEALSAPLLRIDLADPLHPIVRMVAASAGGDDTDGRGATGKAGVGASTVRHYFEVDVSPGFESAAHWRFPALIPERTPPDLTSRHGIGYRLFQTQLRDQAGGDRLVFSFRATAMAYRRNSPPNFVDLAKYAQLVGYGLGTDAVIREVFRVVRQTNIWADETRKRTPLETFAAGLGECVHANELAGALLEINGVRTRTVGGFNPLAREIMPGSGHGAIEASNSAGRWEYENPYLDLYATGFSARELHLSPIGETAIFAIDNRQHNVARYGAHVTLASLFRLRSYADAAGRLPPAGMLQLAGAEDLNGRDWHLRSLLPEEVLDLDADIPAILTIFVRGRQVLSACPVAVGRTCADQDAVATPWGVSSFTIEPRRLLAAVRAARAP